MAFASQGLDFNSRQVAKTHSSQHGCSWTYTSVLQKYTPVNEKPHSMDAARRCPGVRAQNPQSLADDDVLDGTRHFFYDLSRNLEGRVSTQADAWIFCCLVLVELTQTTGRCAHPRCMHRVLTFEPPVARTHPRHTHRAFISEAPWPHRPKCDAQTRTL